MAEWIAGRKGQDVMQGFRLWHLMLAVALSGLTLTVARMDDSCTPFSPILASLELCGFLGILGAKHRGRPWKTGFWLGLLLGPIGLIVAWSHPVPKGWPLVTEFPAERSS
jgi:hypothetical protein